MAHPLKVEKYDGSSEELAGDMTHLEYDSLAKLLGLVADNLATDSEADNGRGRTKLADCLAQASTNVRAAALYIKNAWEICKPYMPKK